jgi:Protein of unknown function (DUF726)
MNNQNVQMPANEKMAILKILAWLCSRDGSIEGAEKVFFSNAIAQFGLDILDIDAFLSQCAEITDILEVSREITNQKSKYNLLDLLLRLALVDGYDARERAGIFSIAQAMSISTSIVEMLENKLGEELQNCLSAQSDNFAEQAKQQTGKGWQQSAWMIGGAAVAGAVLIGATGGLAAPAIGGFIGANFLGLSGAAATSAGLATLGGGSIAAGGMGMAGGTMAVSGLFGLAGAGVAGVKYSNLIGNLEEFTPLYRRGSSAHSYVGISGFLTQDGGFISDWDDAFQMSFPDSAHYILQWESKVLADFGNTFTSILATSSVSAFIASVATRATSAAFSCLAPPAAVMSAMTLIDNPWHIAGDRAEKAGKALGYYIEQRGFGMRPISLIGFSLGTKVILSAAEYLAERKIYGAIDDIFLLGGAVSCNDARLKHLQTGDSKVVAGSTVNAYSCSDFVLKYIYRAAQLGDTPIGIQAIENSGVINCDLTEIVKQHGEYSKNMPAILHKIRQQLGRAD